MAGSIDKREGQKLIDDIECDLVRLDKVYVDLKKSKELLGRWLPSDEIYYKLVEAAATELHALYTGIEKVFERVIVFSTGHRPQGKASHKSILKVIHEELKLTSPSANEFLGELSSFRHLFRHAYGIDLSATDVIEGTNQTCGHWPQIREEITQFQVKLGERLRED